MPEFWRIQLRQGFWALPFVFTAMMVSEFDAIVVQASRLRLPGETSAPQIRKILPPQCR
jgi:hypothetical protein